MTKNSGLKGFMYQDNGRLKKDMHEYPIFECNYRCACYDECKNRVVQHGRKVALNIMKTPRKGWGVFADSKAIPAGTYIGTYAGELLTNEEGEERGRLYNKFGRTYLFDIDFWYLKGPDPLTWESIYVYDAFHAGNFTRFINHSCDPNVVIVPCYINEANIDKPLLTFFALKNIKPHEEICFSYTGVPGDDDEEEEVKEQPTDGIYIRCRCGSRNCKGRMWN
ncbi:SET domain-containing protein [Punctularia strigosozonata HHB-11173 SS5]|uniref:SET domain-containing protein n=1 Tax=Punctularia strigosozonata (strain HHB-11173) TaxID=741275 RepID=UPI00044183EE|nr:SET domain-containing protein [Punctularia strigosozonata HHB-11173 SS5]EIN14044.1 SET domain-containing protein [Punctularia strigosozonata HHB-11173 SS5]